MYYKLLMAVLVTLFLVSCDNTSSNHSANGQTPNTTQPVDTPPKPQPVKEPAGQVVKPQEFKLDGKDLVVDISDEMTIEDLGTFILICSSEVVRDARCFELEKFTGKQETFTNWEAADLGNGRKMYFKIDGPNEVEDGAKVSELTGYFQIESQWYMVTCADRSTELDPNPFWCLPYLASLRKGDLS